MDRTDKGYDWLGANEMYFSCYVEDSFKTVGFNSTDEGEKAIEKIKKNDCKMLRLSALSPRALQQGQA